MNIQPAKQNPSFNSKIKIVDSFEFSRQNIRPFFYCGKPSEPLEKSIYKGLNFWTSEVKTCTSGGVVGGKDAAGFHLFDCKENINKVEDEFIQALNTAAGDVKSALVIGSKDLESSPHSIPLFDAVTRKIKEFVTPSIFKTHSRKYSGTDIGYDKNQDTWFINTVWLKNPMMQNSAQDVRTIEELKASFDKIKIAPQDTLFIGGKEIKKSDYPELF